MVGRFEWVRKDEFVNRVVELRRLEDWWESAESMPINLFGRRRVGKSWLFRRFAHGKPAVVLVARRATPGAQLASFAAALEPMLGVTPSIPDVASLFRVLYRMARSDRVLVVVDEFPSLLPSTEAGIERELSAIQAVIEEERDASQIKLVLCGSMVSQMEALLAERNPLHGRLIPLRLGPLAYPEAALFLPELDPLERFERFAIAGGMPRYLSALGRGSVRAAVCRELLEPNGPLWDEGRAVLEQELRESRVYFSILQVLAGGSRELNEVAQAVRLPASSISKYLGVLQDMRIVVRRLPIGADRSSRSGHWTLQDPFLRFWFRFVFPFQDELETGLGAGDLFDAEVAPVLNEHISSEFEEWCRHWVRTNLGAVATTVGAWWGPSRHELRRTGERQNEEIDVVGIARNRVTVVGEAKWRRKRLDVDIVRDLEEFKLPALAQAGFDIAANREIVLFSRSGYTNRLVEAAHADARIRLVDVGSELRSDPK